MNREDLCLNYKSNKAVTLALGLMLGLCPVSRGYAALDDSQIVTQMQKKVKGQVLDATGEPLIGVNVSVIGQTGGTITDIKLEIIHLDVRKGAKLKFSYIGYKEQVIEVGDRL